MPWRFHYDAEYDAEVVEPMSQPRRTRLNDDSINAAMQWGQFQAQMTNFQSALTEIKIAIGQMVTRSELETRMAESERRFKQNEADIEDLRRDQQKGDDRTITQQSAVMLALGSAIITAILYYVVTHLH